MRPTLTDDVKAFLILRPPSSRTVKPSSNESRPADGLPETQRLDIRDSGLGWPTDPARSPDVVASAQSSAVQTEVTDRNYLSNDARSPTDFTEYDVETDFSDPRGKEKEGLDLDTNSCDLYVPLIIVKNKTSSDEYERKGGNQLKGCLTSGATYLEHLGVQNFQLFGILTEGTVSVVTCAWNDTLIHPAIKNSNLRTATRTAARIAQQIPKVSDIT